LLFGKKKRGGGVAVKEKEKEEGEGSEGVGRCKPKRAGGKRTMPREWS